MKIIPILIMLALTTTGCSSTYQGVKADMSSALGSIGFRTRATNSGGMNVYDGMNVGN